MSSNWCTHHEKAFPKGKEEVVAPLCVALARSLQNSNHDYITLHISTSVGATGHRKKSLNEQTKDARFTERVRVHRVLKKKFTSVPAA
jgi:hypothetical protein